MIPDDNLDASGELLVVGRKNAAVTIDDKVRYLSIVYCSTIINLLSLS